MGQSLCVSPRAPMCEPLATGHDASADGMDAGGADADAGGSLPPSILCHNGTCFSLSDSLRANLVLLLWPSNLPAVGSTVAVWADQSGKGNDALALDSFALPKVIPDGVHLDQTRNSTGFVVRDSPSLDFGSGDFALVVVAGLPASANFRTLVSKSDEARANSRRISIEWALSSFATGRPQGTVDDTAVAAPVDTSQPSVGAYALYRAVDHLELHLNTSVLNNAELPLANQTTSNVEDLYVGVTDGIATPVDSIETVIALRGPVASADLHQLELFLGTAFAVGPR